MVEVLRQMENGPKENPWQFTEATWHRYSKQVLKAAPEAEHRRVAWEFTMACVRQCSSLNIPITPYYVALMWNAGIGNYMAQKLTKAHWDFADRANNLYFTTP